MGASAVIHYTCDRCKCAIDAENDLRYIVRLEVRAAMDCGHEGDDEGDRDYLLELDEVLERAEDDSSDLVADDIYQQMRFDLCCECYRKFIKRPVGRETVANFNFSQN